MPRPSSPRATASALMASSNLTAPTTPVVAVSPLVESYQMTPVGHGGALLPRPPQVFQAPFGPNPPLWPMTIDMITPDSEQPTPRRVQYPVAWNLPVGVPGSEGLGKLAPFGTLRTFADAYSVIRVCLDRRIQQIIGFTWDIVPTPAAKVAMEGSATARADWEKRKAEMVEFWMRFDRTPDSPYTTWEDAMRAMLEDNLVCDAVAVKPVRAKAKGAGVCGSDYASLTVCDGTTFRPLYDVLGGVPPPQTPAYQQFMWGVPRVDFTTMYEGEDLATLEDAYIGDFTYSQILYLKKEKRTWTPYGQSAIEKVLLPIQIGLARQNQQLQFYTTGSVPYMFVFPGNELIQSPQQVRQLQNALNRIAGDTGWKQKIIVLPPNSKAQPIKPNDLADQFDEWILSLCTMGLGMTPIDIGIAPKVAAIQSPGASNQMNQAASQTSKDMWLEPYARWWQTAFFTHIIQNLFGQKDMMWSFTGLEGTTDHEALVTEAIKTTKTSPLRSIDEGRELLGLDALGLPETTVPIVITATGVVPLGSAAAAGAAQASADTASAQQRETRIKNPPPPPPPPPPGQPQQPPQPPHKPTTGTTAHQEVDESPMQQAAEQVVASGHEAATKALAELDILRRVLKRGRPLDSFTTSVLPAPVLAAVEAVLPVGVDQAIDAGRRALERTQKDTRRDARVHSVGRQLMAELGTTVRKAKQGQIGVSQMRAKAQVAWVNAVSLLHREALQDAVDDGCLWPEGLAVTIPKSKGIDAFAKSALRNGPVETEVRTILQTLAEVYELSYRKAKGPVAAGLVVLADDTGRVLMVQRAQGNQNTTAAGCWEWPGGKLDGLEPLEGAKREFEEEVGLPVPKGELSGSWTTTSGNYVTYVWRIPHESDVELPEGRSGLDGSGDHEIENVAWWDPKHLVGNPATRIEVQSSDWAQLASNLKSVQVHKAAGWEPGKLIKDSSYGEAGTEALRRWYNEGAEGQISWSDPHDFTQCVEVAGKYIDDPEGYCQLRHMDATGMTTAEHAHEYKAAKPDPKAQARKGQQLRLKTADKIEAHYQPQIHDALKPSGVKEAVKQALAQVGSQKAVSDLARAAAQAAVQTNVKLDTTALARILQQLGMDGWLSGTAVGVLHGGVSEIPVGSFDWDTWTPGNPEASLQAAGGGLADLLSQAQVTIQGITDTQLGLISTAIAQGIATGQALDTIVSAVTAIRTNPYRSQLIARTETSRAQQAAATEAYQNAGLTMGRLLTAPTPCENCEALAEETEATPVPLATLTVPQHPQCRCTKVPVFTTAGQGSSNADLQAAFETANPTVAPTRSNVYGLPT